MPQPIPLYMGDVLKLKKPHACGENRWEVIRLGADIKLRCQQCSRIVMLPRAKLERRIKAFYTRGSSAAPDAQPPG